MKKYILIVTLGLAPFLHASGQQVIPAFNDYSSSLGGTTADYQWSGDNAPDGVSPSISGSAGQWLQGIASNSAASGVIFSGQAAYPGDTTDFLSPEDGGGIYAFFSQTHFSISSTVPLSDLQSFTLQIEFAEGLSTPYGGDTVGLVAQPVLSIVTASGTTNYNPTYSLLEGQSPTAAGGFDTNLDLWGYQWDLSSITQPVESYTLDWQTSYHSITYGEDVTESSVAQPQNILTAAVPEPGAPSMLTLSALTAGVAVFWGRKRRFRLC